MSWEIAKNKPKLQKNYDWRYILSWSSTTPHYVSDKNILCDGYILSDFSNNIYKIFCHTKMTIEL